MPRFLASAFNRWCASLFRLALFRFSLFFSFTIQLLFHAPVYRNTFFCIILLHCRLDMQNCRMNKTPKSKAIECGCDAWPEHCSHTSPRPNNPNANYAMYESDRIAKAKAQPKLPSVDAPSVEIIDAPCVICATTHEQEPTDIISRMEENQARFGSFPSLLVSAENERRLQLCDRKDRCDDAMLEAHMEAQRRNEGEDE